MDHKHYVMAHIEEIDEILHFEYGSPDHGNKDRVLDEVIYILLARRTRGTGYQKAYNELRRRYPRWNRTAKASDASLLKIIDKAGLGAIRVREIKAILEAVKAKFGKYSLERLRVWNNPRCFKYLTSLPGFGPKSARCVMMYSLSRKVFPADVHCIRITKRLGIIPDNLNHKKAQNQLAEVFPKKIRYSLHVNMVSHGREICRSIKPLCGKCVLAGFCSRNRKDPSPNGNPGFIDLFAGPGGMSLGFEKNGFTLQAAIESDRHASATFLHNRPIFPASRCYELKIQDMDASTFKKWKPKVILAGPPCQEFSHVRQNGRRTYARRRLYAEVLRFAQEIKPTFVVIENVPGMASTVKGKWVGMVEKGLGEIGYEVKSDYLDTQKYGIPQRRKRLFFIARKIDGRSKTKALDILERVWDRIKSMAGDDRVTFLDGVSGLPRLKAGQGADLMRNSRPGRRSTYLEKLGPNSHIIYNHIARKHNPDDLKAYRIMKDGDNALDLYRKAPHLMRYSRDSFHTKYYKIRRDAPSPTIVSHLKKDANSFIHPIDNRGITPREAARLQSFPDSYRFLGSFGVQFTQIGNAVPPMLAEIIARAIMHELKQNEG